MISQQADQILLDRKEIVMKHNNKKGMTLVEIVVTIAFLGIVMIPVINQLATINTINIGSGEKLESYNLCQAYIEQLTSSDQVTLNLLQDQEIYKDYTVMIQLEKAQHPSGSASYYSRASFINDTLNLSTSIDSINNPERFIVIQYNEATTSYDIESEASLANINQVYTSQNISSFDITFATQWPLYKITVNVYEDDSRTTTLASLTSVTYIDK